MSVPKQRIVSPGKVGLTKDHNPPLTKTGCAQNPGGTRTVILDVSLFSPDALLDDHGFLKATVHLQEIIAASEEKVALHVIFDGLVKQPYTLEYICSGENNFLHFDKKKN
jgi:hypothetical protein